MKIDIVIGHVLNFLVGLVRDNYKKNVVKIDVRIKFDDGSRIILKGDVDDEENEIVEKTE